ncbi:hypothetical protein AZ28_1513 [Bordetella pertussis B200]|nr:hypothetical protein AZ28_1513 [Bordetella pertussis B200]
MGMLLLLLVVLLLNILAALVRRWRLRRDTGLAGLYGRHARGMA